MDLVGGEKEAELTGERGTEALGRHHDAEDEQPVASELRHEATKYSVQGRHRKEQGTNGRVRRSLDSFRRSSRISTADAAVRSR